MINSDSERYRYFTKLYQPHLSHPTHPDIYRSHCPRHKVLLDAKQVLS